MGFRRHIFKIGIMNMFLKLPVPGLVIWFLSLFFIRNKYYFQQNNDIQISIHSKNMLRNFIDQVHMGGVIEPGDTIDEGLSQIMA